MPDALEVDLLKAERGSVTAPAGHGKTRLIAATIAAHPSLRFLVLTHTNAGVMALKRRIASIPRVGPKPQVETLSSLALRVTRAFPVEVEWIEADVIDHGGALAASRIVLERPTVVAALSHSYDALIVDEYQDCSHAQHELVKILATRLPTAVLGDPMQGIFDFNEELPMVNWSDVEEQFPSLGSLVTPHRWTNSSPRLGAWIAGARQRLNDGQGLGIEASSPVNISYLRQPATQGGLAGLIPRDGTLAIIIGDSKKHWMIAQTAKSLTGRVAVLEAVEMSDLVNVAVGMSQEVDLPSAVLQLIDFATKVSTNVRTSQVATIERNLKKSGTAGAGRSATADAVRRVLESETCDSLDALLGLLTSGSGRNVSRPDLLRPMRRTLKAIGSGALAEMPDAVRSVLESQRNEMHGSLTRRCLVGSTLRMKGLEFDHVILLEPSTMPSKEHLYVAMSRATTSLTLALARDGDLGKWH